MQKFLKKVLSFNGSKDDRKVIIQVLGIKITFNNLHLISKNLYWKRYNIIPFGGFCLPRVIATVNRFKPRKSFGEKSYPFDIAFCWNFDAILDNLENNFANFYDDIVPEKSDDGKIQYQSSKLNALFNHDRDLSLQDFKEKYNKRIKNLYNTLETTKKETVFLLSYMEKINDTQFERLKSIISKYRKDLKYKIVIINLSEKIEYISSVSNVYVINGLTDNFNKINYQGDWVTELKENKSEDAKIINKTFCKEFKKILHKKII